MDNLLDRASFLKLPEDFVKAAAQQLGDETEAFLDSFLSPPCRGIRLNPMKRPEGMMPDGMGERVPWEEDGYLLSMESDAGKCVLHEAGAWYLQEPSAMLPARVLDAKPGEKVLDLCAAPGGKSGQILATLKKQGLLVSNEIVPSRAKILSQNLERLGAVNALVISEEPRRLKDRWPDTFDAVLVDAPCSGEGMFRRHPETRDEWSLASVKGCQERQREILSSAACMVKAGGRLVYSTCTLNRMENEDNVEWFLDTFRDFALTPFSLPGADGEKGYFTCYPHRVRGEGQFTALFRKTDGEEREMKCISPVRPEKEEIRAAKEVRIDLDNNVHRLGTKLFRLAVCPDLQGLKVYRAGVFLGEVRKGIFQMDHALAVCSDPPDLERIELTETEAKTYLSGGTIQVNESLKGWKLPCYAGLPLGFGKASGGILKNHYPKGLRRELS